jgi:hypothetical protein
MKKLLVNILFLVIFIITGLIILREFNKYGERLVYIYNNPPAVNNLVFNSTRSWKYELDTILNSRTLTFPDTNKNTNLYCLTDSPSLVFRFSGNMCSPCIDFVIDRISFCIQDFKENDRVLFLYSDANPVMAENYFVKQSWYITDSFHQELDNLMIPYLCILDSEHRIKSLYIPDMAYPELLDKYLEMVRDKLNVNEMQQQ